MYRVYTDLSGPRHRYVSAQLLPKMLGQGWVQEEEVFCFLFSSAAVSRPLKTVSINAPLADRVQPLDQCRAGTADGLPCLAVSNLAADEITVVGVGSPTTRMKMNTRGRAPGALSSAGPYYPLGAARFHPFAGHAVDTELWLRYVVELYSATLDDDGSHAYGHPTLEWLDTRSGLPLHFSVLTFGRNTGDYFGRDALTGAVIVGTTYRQDSPFLLNYDTPTLAVPFQAPTGVHRAFHFSMTRQEFRRVLDRARELDPALSAEPGDYVITALRYKNEIVGNGSIDASIWPLTLDLLESRR